jgi:PTS system N-acetylglucosamine-specific IIC component
MSGFFPVMMFGLPAACLAMYRSSRPERRKAVGGMLLSMALTSFLTGVTEPIEFSFMFLAPVLYAIHAVLTGVAMAGMDLLGIKLGFGFSGGFFDYVLNLQQATQPLLLIPVGLVYFALYYGLFRFFIVKLDLKTPGRDAEEAAAAQAATQSDSAQAWIRALGGAGNLTSLDACTTRLRLTVVDQNAVNDATLKSLGARGVVRPSSESLQVVVGPIADQLASEIRAALKQPVPGMPVVTQNEVESPHEAKLSVAVDRVLAALGGAANVRDVQLAASRVCVTVNDAASASNNDIDALQVRAVARPTPTSIHLIVGPAAKAMFEELNGLLARTA